jgi:TolA-binding protein
LAAPPEPQSPIEGFRAWVAQLDRSLGIRTYLLGAAAVLGLAASAVALVLVAAQGDSSTKDDVSTLRTQISQVQERVTQESERRVGSLEERVTALERRLDQVTAGQQAIRRGSSR